jgi:hypothetical protein
MCEPFVARQISIRYSNLFKQTWAYPRQHLQKLLWCVVSVRLKLPEVEERKLCLWYTPTRRNHKELSLDFLEANMSVLCFHLLIGQSNVVVEFHPCNVEPHCASEAELHLGWIWSFHLSSTLLCKLCAYYANGFDKVESVHLFYSNPILGDSNGKLPLRTCPECSVPYPYRSPDRYGSGSCQNRPKGWILIN